MWLKRLADTAVEVVLVGEVVVLASTYRRGPDPFPAPVVMVVTLTTSLVTEVKEWLE